jgi:hypothetical protein
MGDALGARRRVPLGKRIRREISARYLALKGFFWSRTGAEEFKPRAQRLTRLGPSVPDQHEGRCEVTEAA